MLKRHSVDSHRFWDRATIIGLPSLLVTLLLCLLTFSDRAAAMTPAAPAAPGSISGRVTDEGGVGLAGIEVTLMHYISRQPQRMTITDEQGAYLLSALGAGSYYLQFTDPQAHYGVIYSDNRVAVADVPPMLVAGRQFTDVNVSLPRAATITGTVRSELGGGLYGVTLWIKGFSGTFEYAKSISYENALTQAVPYQFTGLAPGVYQVCASVEASSDVTACYGDIFESRITDDITVTEAAILDNINIIVDDSQKMAIVGDVHDVHREQLSNVRVRLLQWENNEWVEKVETVTDWHGRFYFGNRSSGTYTLAFTDLALRYIPAYYGNTFTLEQAQSLKLTPNQRVTALEMILTPFAQIDGTILIRKEAAPLYAALFLYQLIDGEWQQRTSTRSDAVTGHYTFSTLRAGEYRIKITSDLGYGQFTTYYGGKTLAEATTIGILDGGRGTIDVHLGADEFNSVLGGAVTEGTIPLANIKVELMHGGDNRYMMAETYTDLSGRYRFGGLLSGDYFVFFSDPQKEFATVYFDRGYPGMETDLTAISVAQNQEIIDADIQMVRGGAISGTVRNNRGMPLEGIKVSAWLPVRLAWASVDVETRTDSNGDYTLRTLWPGTYHLVYEGTVDDKWVIEYYGSAEFFDQAIDVQVQSSTVVTGIDLIFGPDTPVPSR